MQKHSFLLVKHLIKSTDVNVNLLVAGDNNQATELLKLFDFNQAEQARLEIKFVRFQQSDWLPGKYFLANHRFSKACFNALKKELNRFDFIYAQGFTAWYFLLNSGKKTPKIISNLHGLNMYQVSVNLKQQINNFFFRRVANFIIAKSDYNISLGGALTNLLIKMGVKQENILVNGSGIESNWLVAPEKKEQNRPYKLLFVGRYERLKGIEELLQCASNIREPFHLSIVGDMPEQIKRAQPNVDFLGSISSEEKLKQLYDSHDILVCPSFSEGLPNVIMEAMARNCAVIATDVGAVAELVSKDNGWLIEANQKALKKALISALNCSEEDLFKMKRSSHEKVTKFVWPAPAIQLAKQLNKLKID